MIRVRLLNVKYSPNLGDGVIADCLEHALARIRPDWDIGSVDLAGREAFGNGNDTGRGLALSLLGRLPRPAERTAFATLIRTLIETRYKARWRTALSEVDAVIIGGGQLLSDAALNFSQKIHHCLGEAHDAGAIATVFGVGVSHPWSAAGKRQFLSAFTRAGLAHVAVRDERSRTRWAGHVAGTSLPHATLCRDPGLLAAEVYGPQMHEHSSGGSTARPVVGVGIVHPNTLALHADAGSQSQTLTQALDFNTGLVRALVGSGCQVQLFTNGPADDESFLDGVIAAMPSKFAAEVQRAPRPLRPPELVETIASMDALVAHRLHANIVAYAYQVPSVGLGWDAKLPAFFASVDRAAFAVDDAAPDPDSVATCVLQALAAPIDPVQHADMLEDTREGIAACADAIDAVLADRAGRQAPTGLL